MLALFLAVGAVANQPRLQPAALRRSPLAGVGFAKAGAALKLDDLTAATMPAVGATKGVARTPPLGFNTWNHFACDGISGEVMMRTADLMVSTGLHAAGFEYVNSDDCWMLAGANRSGGGTGPQVPNPSKFPGGIEKVIQHVHDAGLKFGLYTARSNRTCAGFAAACMHEVVDAAKYAKWGVDYLKDDSCGPCRKTDTMDYAAMAAALAATGRQIVLTVEGSPPVQVMSKGGHGQAKRVGHDIRPFWYSVLSEVDLSSGLWSYAHNASSALGDGNGFWNDMDIIEVGNGNVFNPQNDTDTKQLNAARAHFTMWCALKSVMLLGNDFSTMSPTVLSVLSNKEAIGISQDALGIQAHRVVSITPPGSAADDIAKDNLANVAPCSAGGTNPLQRWWYRDAHSGSGARMLRITACNSSDPYQQWTRFTGVGVLPNAGMSSGTKKVVVDSTVGPTGIQFEWRSPIGFASEHAQSPPPSQLWSAVPEPSNASRFKLRGEQHKGCLNVFGKTGPDVALGKGCKTDPFPVDSNEVFAWEGKLLRSFTAATPKCLAATTGASGGYVYTKDASGAEWCLVGDGYADGHGKARSTSCSAVPCAEAEADPKFPLLTINNSAAGVTMGDGTNNINFISAQFGASGPVPRATYLKADPWGTPEWSWDLRGGAMKPPAAQIFNDNSNVGSNASSVPKINGSEMCVTLMRGGNLEVWTGPLSGGRVVVVLLNRYYKLSAITAEWSRLGLAAGQKMSVRDVWAKADVGVHSGSYTEPAVPSHGVTLLVLTPTKQRTSEGAAKTWPRSKKAATKTDDAKLRSAHVNESIIAHRVLLTAAAVTDGAVAIDGSPGSYHIARAPTGSPNTTKWHVHLQGGGWCFGVADCAGRALGSKGSSMLAPNNHSIKVLPDECACAQSGYFSADPARNPTMHDWTHVHVNYVDGGSFSGNRSSPVLDPKSNRTLYFRGKRILKAVLLDLRSKGMDAATAVVLSGCSAGGLAVYLQADFVATFLPKTTKLVAVPDSGFFYAAGAFEGEMRNAATRFFNMETNAACQASSTTKPGDCAFAQYVSPFVRTPIFAVQSIYDGWQLDAIARPPDWGRNATSKFGQHECKGGNKACLAAVNAFGSKLNASINSALLNNPKHGGFIDSCNHHCGSWASDLTMGFIDPRVDGDELVGVGAAFDRWYAMKPAARRVWSQPAQGFTFPCDGCCRSVSRESAPLLLKTTDNAVAATTPPPSTQPQLLIYEGSGSDMGAMTAIGLLNRPATTGAKIFSAAYYYAGGSNHHAADWLREAVDTDPKLKGAVLTNTTNSSVVIAAALQTGAAKGFVLYNSSEGVDLLPTIVTLSGVFDAIAIDCGFRGNRDRQHLCAAGAVSAPVLFDARNRWKSNLTAGAYAAEYLLDRTGSNDLMAVADPGLLAQGYLVDVVVQQRLFVMANKICTPFSASSKLFDKVAESEHWNREHLLSVMGYNGAEEVLNLCVLRHDVISLVSDFVINLSFLSLMTGFFETPHAPLPPLATVRYNASKVYVALVRSDGDNLQIVTGGQRDQMEHRVRNCSFATADNMSVACPYQSWTLSNRLLQFAPSVLRWWYEQANKTGRDSFLFGPSGYGYNWPSLIEPETKAQQFADDTANASAALHWPAYIHWDYATVTGDAIKKYIGRLNNSAIQAAFINFPTSLFIEEDRVGTVELIRCHQALDLPPAHIAKALNKLKPGSTSFLYQVWSGDWSPESWMPGVAERVEFVGHRELIELRRQSRK